MSPVSATFTDRLNEKVQLLTQAGTSLNKLNNAAGLSAGYLSRLCKGERKMPGIELMEPIAAALRVRLDWLQRGIGARDLPPDPPEWESLPEAAKVALLVLAGRGEELRGALKRVAALPQKSNYAQFLAAAQGQEVQALELPADYLKAIGHLEVVHGRDFMQAGQLHYRSVSYHKPEGLTLAQLAEQIYSLAAEQKGKRVGERILKDEDL